MINRALITSLIFFMSNACFAADDFSNKKKVDIPNTFQHFSDSVLLFLPKSDWVNFKLATSNKTGGVNIVNTANEGLNRGKLIVYLNDNKDAEFYNNVNNLDKITGFAYRHFTKKVDQNDLINLLANENTRKLVLKEWEKETITAVEEGREPYYLRLISKLEAFKLKKYLDDKTQSKTQDIKHAYSVFFSMAAYKYSSGAVTRVTANKTARESFRDALSEAAREAINNIRGTGREALRNIGENHRVAYRAVSRGTAGHFAVSASVVAAFHDANDAFNKAARKAAWDVVWDTAWKASKEAGMNAGKEAAMNAGKKAAMNAAMNAINPAIAQPNNNDLKSLAYLTYRVVEKTVFLHFLDNFEKIVDASYKASIDEMMTIPLDSIFESQVKWNEFKTAHFGEIENNPEAFHFLEHLIEEMGGIVDTIEGSAEPARKKQKA